VTQGLRERKKAETRQLLWSTAVRLFEERGFDNVSVAEIAAAANVSKMTVFNYFATKEDLIVGPMDEHIDEPAQVVRARPAGQSAVAALRAHFLDRLAARDTVTGLNDNPGILSVLRLVENTPTLAARVLSFAARSQAALATALAETTGEPPDALTPRLVAAQLIGVQFALVSENRRTIASGVSADAAYPAAKTAAETAFDLLEKGLGGYGAS
jgi:AcrR family transcriptional regulator